MNASPGPLRALAATARLANLPSVVSNVWLGILLAGGGSAAICAAITVSAVCLYLCGTFLNDWADRGWDAAHRPERALPRGLFAPAGYLALAVAAAALGSGFAAAVSWHAIAVAVAILGLIALYTWLHKKSAWSLVPMAMCRALLPVLGLAAVAGGDLPPVILVAAAGLFCHVAGISWLARGEARRDTAGRDVVATSCFAACAGIMACGAIILLQLPVAACVAGVLAYLLWTTPAVLSGRSTIAARVSTLLAGIPWVDWMLLLPMYLAAGRTPPSGGLCLWLPPAAVISGKIMQRVAAAT